MKLIDIEVDGKLVKVKAARTALGLWMHFNGQTHFIEAKVSSRSAGKAVKLNSHQVASKMPGKIVKVNKKVGDKVIQGDVVVIMEAMKMEYSLEAGQSGKIKSVNCKEGQQVTPSLILVEIE